MIRAHSEEQFFFAKFGSSLPNIVNNVSLYRRGKCDKVFTGLLALFKNVGCDKHLLPFARLAKQTKIHYQRFCNNVSFTLFFAVCETFSQTLNRPKKDSNFDISVVADKVIA